MGTFLATRRLCGSSLNLQLGGVNTLALPCCSIALHRLFTFSGRAWPADRTDTCGGKALIPRHAVVAQLRNIADNDNYG